MQLSQSSKFLHLITNLCHILSLTLPEARKDWVAGGRDLVPQDQD